MDKDKQIEEMALALSEGGCGKECNCIQADKFNCHLLYNASVLYNAGYRKTSDIAREIFEKIEKTLNRKLSRSKPRYEELNCNEGSLSIWGHKDMGYFQGIIATAEDIQYLIDELKKKYIGEDTNVTTKESEKDNG